PSGTVIIGEKQTTGRGRLGRRWYSPPCANLYCSILLRCGLPTVSNTIWLCWLPLIAGVGVLQAIKQIAGVAASLKWPNDVLVGRRKVAGILCESTGIGSPAACVIVGIGISVNMDQKDLPEEI